MSWRRPSLSWRKRIALSRRPSKPHCERRHQHSILHLQRRFDSMTLQRQSPSSSTLKSNVRNLLPRPFVSISRPLSDSNLLFNCFTELSYSEWRQQLESDGDNPLWALLPFFPASGFGMNSARYGNTITDMLLQKHAVRFEQPTEKLICLYAAALQK
jgi:hypothetical protein